MRLRRAAQVLGLVSLATVTWSMGYVYAYQTDVNKNLLRTRDALLDQRSHLEQSADAVGKRIDELNRQLDIINSYLRDTDKAIRDVNAAMAGR